MRKFRIFKKEERDDTLQYSGGYGPLGRDGKTPQITRLPGERAAKKEESAE